VIADGVPQKIGCAAGAHLPLLALQDEYDCDNEDKGNDNHHWPRCLNGKPSTDYMIHSVPHLQFFKANTMATAAVMTAAILSSQYPSRVRSRLNV
jgi:hypothetical protein